MISSLHKRRSLKNDAFRREQSDKNEACKRLKIIRKYSNLISYQKDIAKKRSKTKGSDHINT